MSDSRYDRTVPPAATERTVIVNNDRAERRGRGSGWFIAGLLVVALLVGGFVLFRGGLPGTGGGDTNVTVDLPAVDLPDVNVQAPAAAPGAAPAN